MTTRTREAPPDLTPLRYRAQQRAAWEFVAAVDDWRCSVCMARIVYEDRGLFEQTNLCNACSHAVNESLVWRNAASDPVV